MKSKGKILVLFFIVAAFGCDDALSPDPIGRITPDQVDRELSVSVMESNVNQSYQLLSNTLNIIDTWNWDEGKVLRNDFILHDIASDDMMKKWAPDGDQAWMDEINNFSFTSDNQAFQGIWSYNYEGISRTNRAIRDLTNEEVLEEINIDSALRDRLLGEVYFLRAFYYFDLVNHFGDVPLVLEPLENFDEAFERTMRVDESEVREQIESDLEQAEMLLPNRKYSSDSDRWRASTGAAMAMQAKVALFQEEWNRVIQIVDDLEGLGFYDLNDNYFDAFDVEQQFQEDEVIFAYNHEQDQTPQRGNGLGALMGWGFVAPMSNFLDAFEDDDPRLDYTVDVDEQIVHKLLGSTDGRYKGNGDGPGNRILIRWADVLLWKAEAYLETNSYNEAITIINEIRERARESPTILGETPLTGTLPDRDTDSTDEEEIREWLIHERRVELGFESQRFNDLKRWGIAEEVLTAIGQGFTSRNYLYPIPQSEIDRSGGEMRQNDGY